MSSCVVSFLPSMISPVHLMISNVIHIDVNATVKIIVNVQQERNVILWIDTLLFLLLVEDLPVRYTRQSLVLEVVLTSHGQHPYTSNLSSHLIRRIFYGVKQFVKRM